MVGYGVPAHSFTSSIPSREVTTRVPETGTGSERVQAVSDGQIPQLRYLWPDRAPSETSSLRRQANKRNTDENGEFELRVAPGNCLQQVVSLGNNRNLMMDYDYPDLDRLFVRSTPSELELAPYYLTRKAVIRVHLQDEDGDPLANKRVGFQHKGAEWFRHVAETDAQGELSMPISNWKVIRSDPQIWERNGWCLITNAKGTDHLSWESEPLRILQSDDESVTLEWTKPDSD